MKNLSKYNKFLVAAIAVVLTGLNAVYGMSPVVQMIIAVATAAGVYQVSNK